ncbi:hypothetical protein CBR_g51349 [Chara braunii]|uniref:Reverse transcriptase domain-containing protein n=1 Tax=Chara braunii TaxID=69332 RepID=A0A388M8M2_CHABU|nr:hypothetical protein CBR_g51349 [Chara braunii]|eukprot:GBG90843.1 hypothetical protein CBR_g51349 [Chara braunii]
MTRPWRSFVLLDFEKAYDRVSWPFLLEGLSRRRIGPRFLSMVKCLLASAASRLLINGYLWAPIAVTRSVRQGCPLSPALYALYIKHLHDMLRADEDLVGLPLPRGRQLKSSAFADDTGAVTATTPASVTALRNQVATFEEFAGARMNWHKSVSLVPDLTAAPLFQGMRVQPMSETATYLGIDLPEALTAGSQMEQLMKKVATRLALCGRTVDAGIFDRVLLANTAASAMLWYAAPVSTPGPVPQREYRSALSKFIWKNDPFAPHTMAESARLHPTDMELALVQPAILTELKRGALWSPFLKMWRDLAPLELKPPESTHQVLQQPLFGNPSIRDNNGEQFPSVGPKGAFGKAWLKAGVARIANLWDQQTRDWQQEAAVLKQHDGQTHKKERLQGIKRAIPGAWVDSLRTMQRFDMEWVTLSSEDPVRWLFQIKAQVDETWLVAEAWETPPSDFAPGQPLIRAPARDGWLPRDLVRSVSVVTDRKGLARTTHRAFCPERRPAQLAVDPAMWTWRRQGLQRRNLPLHQVFTKGIYRTLSAPYRMDQELQYRWAR